MAPSRFSGVDAALGEMSPFHTVNGVYAEGVDTPLCVFAAVASRGTVHPVVHADWPELLVVDAPWQVVTDTRGRVIRWSSATTPAAAAGWYVYLREP